MNVIALFSVIAVLASNLCDAELQRTSFKLEVALLKKLYEKGLEEVKAIIKTAGNICPACVDDCADTCLTKQLLQFKERLERQLEVVCELEEWAARECPGKYWVAAGDHKHDHNAPGLQARASGVSEATRGIQLSVDGQRDTIGRMMTMGIKCLVVASGTTVVVDDPFKTKTFTGEAQAVTYDSILKLIYVARKLDTGESVISVIITSNDTTKDLVTYPASGKHPVDMDIAMNGMFYVLLTNGTDTELEKIENINTSPSQTTKTYISGVVARRLTINTINYVAYISTSGGIYEIDLASDDSPIQVSAVTNAVGIAYNGIKEELVFCNNDNGNLTFLDPETENMETSATDMKGCSDLGIYMKQSSFRNPGEMQIFVVDTSINQVNEYRRLKDTASTRLVDAFTASTQVSIAVWVDFIGKKQLLLS